MGVLAFKLVARENVAFYTKQDFLFHVDRYHFDGPSSSSSFKFIKSSKRISYNEHRLQIVQANSSRAGSPGWSLTRPKLVFCEAW